jgi:hypothetical protein
MSRDVKTALNIYSNPIDAAGFSTARRLLKAIRSGDTKARNKPDNKRLAGVEAWLQTQDSYTLHRIVTNVMNIWEIDLMDVQNIAKHNDGVNFLLSAIDVFSYFLHLVPQKKQGRV